MLRGGHVERKFFAGNLPTTIFLPPPTTSHIPKLLKEGGSAGRSIFAYSNMRSISDFFFCLSELQTSFEFSIPPSKKKISRRRGIKRSFLAEQSSRVSVLAVPPSPLSLCQGPPGMSHTARTHVCAPARSRYPSFASPLDFLSAIAVNPFWAPKSDFPLAL